MRPLQLAATLALTSILGCASNRTTVTRPESAAPTSPTSGPVALARLTERLRGTWRAEPSPGKHVTESFRSISGESALVETYTTSSGRETATVYHADHDALLLTHYCAQGNQPRLQLTTATESDYVFLFRDATNVLPGQSCLIEKRLSVTGDVLDQTEIYRSSEGTLETTRLRFARSSP
jgi:hypothetical protein